MTYNLTIKNKGTLPIPYITKCGEAMAVDQLYPHKELFCDSLFIGATGQRQLLIHCTKIDYIIEPSPDVEINIHATPKPVSVSDK